MTTLISASKVLAKVIYKLSLLANIDFHNDSGKTESDIIAKVNFHNDSGKTESDIIAKVNFHDDSGKTESDIIAKVNFHIYLPPSSKTKLSIELAEKATQLASSMARMF